MEGDEDEATRDAGDEDREVQKVDDEESRPPTAMSEAVTVASTQPDTAAAASQPQSSQAEPFQLYSSQPSSQPKKTAPKKQAASKATASKPRSKRTPSEDRDNAYSIPSDAESDDLDFGGGDNDAPAEKRVFRERKPKAKTEQPKLSGIQV